MIPYLGEIYGNPHSNDHYFGWTSKQAVDVARKYVSSLINADPDEIIFTSGASEANNLAILGNISLLKKIGKTKILVSAFEHKCVLESAKAAQMHGVDVAFIQPTSEGFVDPDELKKMIDKNVGLVSVMTVNNEIGTTQPIEDLCRIAHQNGSLFHTDAAQAGVFKDMDVADLDVDLLSLSAHKIYGPKGIGSLYVKRDIQKNMTPLIFGGGQEAGLRSGTLPTMLCVGFGEACRIAKEEREKNIAHLARLSALFWSRLRAQCPDVILNGSMKERHPGNLNIQFRGVESHSLLQALQPHVAASTGSACTTGTPEPSYVLRAIGLSPAEAAESVRFSFGLQNTEEQVIKAIDYILEALRVLRDSFASGALHSDEGVVLQSNRKCGIL